MAGDLVGLTLGAGSGAPPLLFLLLALLLLLSAGRAAGPAVVRAPGSSPPTPDAGAVIPGTRSYRAGSTLLLMGASAAAGAALGAEAGERSAVSCLSRLPDRSRVLATGRLLSDLPASRTGLRPGDEVVGARPASAKEGRRAGSTVRVRLAEVELVGRGRRCRIPELAVRSERPRHSVAAGARVGVAGRWWSFRDAGWPRPLSRLGMVSGDLVPLASPRPGPLTRLRAAAARRLRSRLPRDVESAGLALTLAERGELDAGLSRRFARAGLAHLLAISGLHVGILAAGVAGLLGFFTRRPRRYLGAAALIGGYVLLIGAPASALRASVLVAGWYAARYRGSPLRSWDLLGAAALLTVLLRPEAPLDVSFQMSFAGFIGLVLGGASARRLLEGRRRRAAVGPGMRRVATAVLAGAGAFALTAPFAAQHFQRTAPVAVLSNFAGVPLVTLALAGLAGAMALPGPLGELAGDGAAAALRLLFRAADAFAGLPFGHADTAPPGALAWAVMGLLFLALLLWASGRPGVRSLVCVGAAVALWVAGPVLGRGLDRDRALLCTLDVGQGDAAVLRTRQGHWLVFDAGPRFGRRDAGRSVVVPFLRAEGATGIQLFVLSHPDMDHLGGAGSLMAAFRVARVLDSGNPVPRDEYAEFLDRVEEEGAEWIAARPGDRLRVDGVEVLVLGPVAGPGAPRGSGRSSRAGASDAPASGPDAGLPPPPRGANEASVSVRVRLAGGFRYVNTGDAPVAAEHGLLARWPADSLRAELMKVGHHGSRSSTGRAWLGAVRPDVAVISAGRGNRYGHPHPAVLRRLEDAGVEEVWRTDRRGELCLEIEPDGRWRIRGEAGWRGG